MHCPGHGFTFGQQVNTDFFFCPAGKLTGMSEITEKLTLPEKCQSDHVIVQQVTAAANVSRVPCGSDKEYR